jgi:hypothetical protein
MPAQHDPKRFATLQAVAALASIQLVMTDDDRGRPCYYVHKWALTNHFDELGDVATWLERVTGKEVSA